MTRERQGSGIRLLLIFGILLCFAAVCWLALRAVEKTEETDELESEVEAEEETEAEPEATAAAEIAYTEAVYVNDDGVEFQVEYGTSNSSEIDASILSNPSVKNNVDLAAWVMMAWENQWGYVWGTYGKILTEEEYQSKLTQYPDGVGSYSMFILTHWLGHRTVDCVGLIKSYGWYDPDTGNIVYNTNDMPDVTTEGMYEAATVTGTIDTIPETVGLIVYRNKGHVGVYVGDGYVIEAIGTEGGVVRTAIDGREWTDWFECPYITYC